MIVPQFWAEGQARGVRDGRTVTVRRFGWSDVSPADAQANADRRAAEALRHLVAGERVARREPRVPYNGAAGVPIREEIVSRHGDTVITRNSYGALCLNTPNVLFADVDHELSIPYRLGCLAFAGLFVLATTVGWLTNSLILGLIVGMVAAAVMWPIAVLGVRVIQRRRRDAEGFARARLARFLEDHPDWAVRIYRTPAGLRLLVTHQPFDPAEPAAGEFFTAVGTDPIYVRMCLNQRCFRARVSPKPWRIGIDRHLRPRPGVWPVRAEWLPARRLWISEYEAAATGYAACEFVEAVGSGIINPAIQPVIKLHDELSRATRGLPLA